MGKRRMVIRNIWKIASDVNEAIWKKWHDPIIQEVSYLDRAPTYNTVRSIWEEGLDQPDLPPFIP